MKSDTQKFLNQSFDHFYFSSRSSPVPPLFLEVFISRLLGLLMGTVAKRIKIEIHYLSLCHLLY